MRRMSHVTCTGPCRSGSYRWGRTLQWKQTAKEEREPEGLWGWWVESSGPRQSHPSWVGRARTSRAISALASGPLVPTLQTFTHHLPEVQEKADAPLSSLCFCQLESFAHVFNRHPLIQVSPSGFYSVFFSLNKTQSPCQLGMGLRTEANQCVRLARGQGRIECPMPVEKPG